MPHQRSGHILLLFLTVMAIGLLFATSVLVLQANVYRSAKRAANSRTAGYFAEAGIDKAFQAYTADPNYAGETFNLAGQPVTTTVETGATANEKYLVATTTVDNVMRRYRMKLIASSTGVAVAFNYAMQAGTNGFVVGNNSTINGSVYSNGNIVGGSNSRIVGNATAVGTITNMTVTGTKKTGASPQPLPPFDANFWKTKAQEGGTINGNHTAANGSTLGPVYITGNLIFGNNANITINGPVYVKGSIQFGNNPILTANDDLGQQGSMVITEQALQLGNNITTNNNGQGGYLLLVTTSTSGIQIGNNATAIKGPLYAPNGTLQIGNNARAVAFTAKLIQTGNNTVIDFDEGLADASFSTGPTGGWAIESGSFQEY